MKSLLLFIFFIFSFFIEGQENDYTNTYCCKGKIKNFPVTPYIEVSDPWIGLMGEINFDETKLHFVEYNFTETMFLRIKNLNAIKGMWMSSDLKKHFPIEIKQEKLAPSQQKDLDNILDQLIYYRGDC